MPNQPTNINQVISDHQAGGADKYLLRKSADGAYTMFKDEAALINSGRGILTPNALRDAVAGAYSPNGAAYPILKNAGVQVNSTGITECNTTAINGDTLRIPVVYTDTSFSVKSYYSYGNHNYVARSEDIMRQINEACKIIRTSYDTNCINLLETNKNQQQVDPYLFGYFTDSGADEFQIDPAKKDFMYNKIHGQFTRMDFPNVQKKALGNPEHAAAVRELYAQGGANDQNTQFQFRGDMSPEFNSEEGFSSDVVFYETNGIVNGAATEETFFVLPTGTVAVIHANDVEKYDQGLLPNGTELSTQILPGLDGVVWGVRKTYGCDDNDLDYEQWQFESRTAYIPPFINNISTDLSAINKYIVKA
jgi:hypothetical protein